MPAPSLLTGRCCCQTVRYAVADEFAYALNCHCADCRRATGAAFKPLGGIPLAQFQLTAGAELLTRYGGADGCDLRCGRCGSWLYSIVRDGQWAHVALGTLDAAPTLRPTAHIWVSEKAPWFTITDTLPQFPGFPT